MGKRALFSVSNKAGIVAFARNLVDFGYEILSTGGTRRALEEANISVTPIEEVTGFPSLFGGRVKTIHPKIIGGILFRRSDAEDLNEAKRLGIEPIDIVAVNLYPFAEKHDIENIDIGGPTLLRSAAKNHESVTVVCDPSDYDAVITELKHGDHATQFRKDLASKAFLHAAAYDALITEWLSDGKNAGVMMTNGMMLRYGENPHQCGKFYEIYRGSAACNAPVRQLGWTILQGKLLSYLNILDADAAWAAVMEFEEPTAVFVKHANPSGIASHANIEEAFQRAYDADRLSAFGVIIAINRECTAAVARNIIGQKMFVEVIVAPSFENDALEMLKQRPNMRVIAADIRNLQSENQNYRSALGGMLLQNADTRIVTEQDLTVMTNKKPSPDQIRDLLFAWKCVKHAKSNAIVFAKDRVTVGIGAGQTSRVDATWIAARRAGGKTSMAVMASDAFFPFSDSVEEAAKHGIAAIIQPGGSIRDADVFSKADELGLTMVTTGIRAFRH